MSLSVTPKIKKNIPEEALAAVSETRAPDKLADLVAGHLGVEVDQKQELLETFTVSERLEKVYGLMQGEMSVLQGREKDQNPRQKPDGAHPARVLSE